VPAYNKCYLDETYLEYYIGLVRLNDDDVFECEIRILDDDKASVFARRWLRTSELTTEYGVGVNDNTISLGDLHLIDEFAVFAVKPVRRNEHAWSKS
jgi:hypothetical protein